MLSDDPVAFFQVTLVPGLIRVKPGTTRSPLCAFLTVMVRADGITGWAASGGPLVCVGAGVAVAPPGVLAAAVTTRVAFMFGWTAQWYVKVPGVLKVTLSDWPWLSC